MGCLDNTAAEYGEQSQDRPTGAEQSLDLLTDVFHHFFFFMKEPNLLQVLPLTRSYGAHSHKLSLKAD